MSIRTLALTTAVATALGLVGTTLPAAAAPSASDRTPYVVIMTQSPALAFEGGADGLAATKPAKGEKIDARSGKVKAYVTHLRKKQQDALRAAGITQTPRNQIAIAANGFAVSLTAGEAAKMRNVKGVAAVQPDEVRHVSTDVSPEFLGVSSAAGAWQRGFTGKGVIVGVIDTGIWPEHPSFADPGGLPKPTGAAAEVPCEFGDTGHNPQDKPFTCQNKLIGARDMRITYKSQVGPEVYNSARDYDGHGTHTASTAAGDRNVKASIFGVDRGTVSGIAPEAGIIAYSALGELGGYDSDLAAAIDQAVADGVDVINYSVGSGTPSLGLDGLAFLFATGAGVYVANSNGNAGPGPGTVGSPAFLPWVTAVGASTHTRTFTGSAILGATPAPATAAQGQRKPKPGSTQTITGASLTEALPAATLIDANDRGNPLCLDGTPFVPALHGEVVLCERGQNARTEKSKAVKDAGGAGMILMNTVDNQELVTDNHWLPTVHVTRGDGLKVRQYISQAGAGATAALTQGEKARTQGSVMAAFSSRGPVAAPGVADIIRPDVTAPGVNILAGNTPTPGEGRPGQLFQAISGTSMSSPQVAGLFALLKQAHPDWSPAIAKSALMTTARQDVTKEDGRTNADPFDFGAGHVDPGRPTQKNTMFDPGIAYDAGLLDYASFACGNIPVQVFYPEDCAALKAAGYSDEAAQLNVPSIGVGSVPGVRVIQRSITNVSGKNRLIVTAQVAQPAGYTVTVTPSRLEMAPGESATFSMTIRNNSAPVGEWRFGGLTWRGMAYAARSPIAVRGSLLTTSSQVTGTGTSGTGSVPVSFGYTGPYSVNAYGLAAPVATKGSVGQDPTHDIFDPSEIGNGVTAHQVDLTGVRLWRMTLKDSDLSRPGQSVDLDVYVYGPDGQRVAASLGAGTDERVELVDPAPGTYTVYIHGWRVGLTPVDYTFHSWAVPAQANAGSLVVTGAPASAKLGQSGTVTYSWSGVEAGATNLGLLSHKNATGQLAVTVVEVTG